jgi:hypothetical protein
MLDVFHLCVIADMGAILYAPRYQGDVVNYSDKHRKSFIRCRDVAHDILLHLDSLYEFKSLSGRRNQVCVVYFKFLIQQVQAFWLQQTKIRRSGPTHPDAIAEAIARRFHDNVWFWKEWAKCSQPRHRSSLRYGFRGEGYTVHGNFSSIQSWGPGQSPISTMMPYRSFTRSQHSLIRTITRLSKTRKTTKNSTYK